MYTIELSEKQMGVLRSALDFYERVMGLGQLEEIEFHWRSHEKYDEKFNEKSDALRHILYSAKIVGWSLSANSSRSIRSDKVPEVYRIAYDMTQIIRKKMSDVRIENLKEEGDENSLSYEMMTVDRNPFWATCDKVSPIKVSWNYENE